MPSLAVRMGRSVCGIERAANNCFASKVIQRTYLTLNFRTTTKVFILAEQTELQKYGIIVISLTEDRSSDLPKLDEFNQRLLWVLSFGGIFCYPFRKNPRRKECHPKFSLVLPLRALL